MAIFSKLLTKTDIGKRLAVPTKYLKSLPSLGRGHAVDVQARDEKGFVWTFRCTIRKRGYQKPVFSKGWLEFVRSKNLEVGDKIKFYKKENETTYKVQAEKKITIFGATFGYSPIGIAAPFP